MPLPLETNRLIIRTFVPEDAESLHAILGDPEVMKEIPGGVSTSADHTRQRIGRFIQLYRDWGFCLYALIDKATDEMVGNCGLIFVEGKGPDVEVSYDIAKKHWNKGYATEAANAVIHYGLTELNLPEIIAITYPHHKASRRVMEKAGMTYRETKTYYDQKTVVYYLNRPS